MRKITKYRIRRALGTGTGWRVVSVFSDGTFACDGNPYTSWPKAIESAYRRLRKNALIAALDEAAECPGEYIGLPARYVPGPDLMSKRQQIAKAARDRGLSIDIEVDHDMEGNYDFYLRKLGGAK